MYLDPAAGSTLFQLAVAGVLSAMATVRLYWKRIRTWPDRWRSLMRR
jgi:hypothetical protein